MSAANELVEDAAPGAAGCSVENDIHGWHSLRDVGVEEGIAPAHGAVLSKDRDQLAGRQDRPALRIQISVVCAAVMRSASLMR
jgi:hypothetical protein